MYYVKVFEPLVVEFYIEWDIKIQFDSIKEENGPEGYNEDR